MTPIRMIQSSPTKANELFAAIADTTPGAVKTRERLFQELRSELELLARLEEEHLLPVLRKHAETKALAPKVLESLRQTRSMLEEMQGLIGDAEAFTPRMAELKRSFQQHRRDEKNELLPALQKALSEEETRAVAEKMVADREAVEEAARQEAEQRRAEARREREQAAEAAAAAEEAERRTREAAREAERATREAAEQARRTTREAAEAAQRSVAATAESARIGADLARQTAETGARAAADAMQRSMDQFTGVFRTTQEASRGAAAAAQCGTVLAQGAQGAAREWMSWAQGRYQNRVRTFGDLLQCRTPQDLIALQTRVAQEEMEQLLETAGRVSSIAAETADEAAKAVTQRA